MGIARFGQYLIGAVLLVGCGGGSNSTSQTGTSPPASPPPESSDSGCTGSCADATSFLSTGDIGKIIAQAVNEASAQNLPATIAVVDRVGNVLAVYRMNGANPLVRIGTNRGVVGGLEGLIVPSELAAVSKAVTGAYLSSEGNAFSTRTASQIVQEHLNPGERNAPSGPLFGVQFSQLPCSDFSRQLADSVSGVGTGPGPHRSPLGLSADPGGFPLYKNGVPVGGIGVAADDDYSLDPDINDLDRNIDEYIAWAGTFGFGAPVDRRGDVITIEGKTFRYTDVEFSRLALDPAAAPAYSSLTPASGGLINVPGYYASAGGILTGTAFGQIESGIRAADTNYSGLDAFVVDDGSGNNRFAPRAGTDGADALTEDEVRVIVEEALKVANRARAQIRRPLSTPARVSVSVVDTNGVALAIARTRDAPIFGTDVSLQKARTAMFNSGAYAAGDLLGAPAPTALMTPAAANYLSDTVDLSAGTVALEVVATSLFSDTLARLRTFLGLPTVLGDGAIAFTDRAGGNMARPYYPDGVDGTPPGPFSYPVAQWSPFQVGQQLDLVYNSVALTLAAYLQQAGLSVSLAGTPLPMLPTDLPRTCTGIPRIANGIQIFPGSVPIYRGTTLVGGVGVSGDGVEQDDMISFLGVHNAGQILGTLGNAPPPMRADNLAPSGAHLRYIQCPQSPFIGSNDDNVCEGK
ncbi:MAG TPA: heme-binding protein [Dokdonella sp.]|uniref:GlcG/HbpS family heme-binding protein n=1 Tax=Dokdonella sp. TaxID=2291710 RepID=UPI002D7E2051|nr:heme-binding protein [Dokdonella sp.]HET9033820.1 heme-binding protein [Dokdonella sp.]